MPTRFQLLFLFAAASGAAAGHEVTVRLYSNQKPPELTLIRGSVSSLVKAGSPALHVSGRWQVRVPGQEPLALAYPVDIRTSGGYLTLMIAVPLEDYIAGVLAGESAGFRSAQSMAAMAVAARTYAVHFLGRHKAEGYDFCDTTHCQDLRIGAMSERLRKAAESTEGELLWFEGSPAATFYGKDCGGTTEAGAVVWPDLKAPYLKSHDDPHCRAQHGWTSTVRKQDLRNALAPRLDSLRIVSRTPSGRASRLQAGGQVISASALRFAVGRTLGWSQVPSDLYELSDNGDRFLFEGRGSGHGVGLCQVGAARMGDDGVGYRQILEFYYPGTKLGVSAQGFTWQSLAGERVDMLTTRPASDQNLIALADRIALAAEQRTGLHWDSRPRLRVYPTVAAFRDATGEPGWVAGSTRGGVIRLQPAAVLSSRGALDSTLRHELLHTLVESRARAGLPLWFREGVVWFLTERQKAKGKRQKAKMIPPPDSAFLQGRESAQVAYAAALDCVAELVERYGEASVLSWISRGIPAGI